MRKVFVVKKFKFNSGFTLIEIIIGVALSSIVSLILYNMLTQTTNVVQSVNSFTNLDSKLAVLYNQMDKTISTAFAPNIESIKSTLSTETVTLIKTSTAKNKQEETAKKIEKIFYSESENNNLKLLTFLSTGAVRGYDESGQNLTRVVYRLVKDEQNPGYFKLLIQQSSKFLDLDILKPENSKIRSYELATGIKSLKFTYYAREEQKEGEKNISRVKLTDWGSKEMLEKYKQKIPEFVDIEGEIWDDQKKRSSEIKFKFNIYCYQEPEKAKTEKPNVSTTQTQTQPTTPAIDKDKNKPESGAPNSGSKLTENNTPKLGDNISGNVRYSYSPHVS